MPRTGRPRTIVLPMDEVRELAMRGWCLRQLAERYDCSRDLMMRRMREAGIPRLPPHSQPGKRNPSWKGGQYLDADGYVSIYAPDHPHASKAGRVLEHRLVMEALLGRYLKSTEVVHHKDKDKQNNHPRNLGLFGSNADHLREELTGHVPQWTPEGLERIRQGILRSLKSRPASIRSRSKIGAPKSRRLSGPRPV